MNLYFSSVASQPSPGHSLSSKAIHMNNNHSNNNKHPSHANMTNKSQVTLTNALNLLTGHDTVKQEEHAPTPVNVVLRRMSADLPWGFRLQGGRDYKLQLTVCKTQSGSPSEGVLQTGDAILTINGESARNFSHEEATEKIKSSGTDLQLTVSRRQGLADLADLRPKGQIKFTAPQNVRR